jgi:hypothetical protein
MISPGSDRSAARLKYRREVEGRVKTRGERVSASGTRDHSCYLQVHQDGSYLMIN